MQKIFGFAIWHSHAKSKKIPLINWLFIMRLSICLAAILTIHISLFAANPSSAQNVNDTRVIFSAQRETLKSALSKLQDASGFNIFYSSANVNANKLVIIDKKDRTVAETLELLLKGTALTYRQNGSSIVISPSIMQAIPARRINGIVLDENGKPVPGVSVRLKKDNLTSTATDENGHFHIDVTNDGETILFSFVGYQSQQIQVQDIKDNSLRLILIPASGSLSEVQIIGYGQTTRRLNTGSVASITAEDLSKETVTNPLRALEGRIAGLQISQSNGNPGSNQTVQVRGVNNLTSNYGLSSAQPLIIIDGVPSTNLNGSFPLNDNLNTQISGANGGLSLFAGLNPQDIERVDVLKDADATAIYGSRGANGVILITTKRGKSGSTSLAANVYTGIEKVAHFVDMLNTEQYLKLRREAFVNDGVTPTTSNAPDLLTWDPNAYTNYQKLLIGGTSHVTDAQLNYTGGNDRIQFFSSGNYHREGSVYMGDFGDTRLIGRVNVTTNSVNRRLKTNFGVSYTDDQTNLPSVDVSTALSLPPNMPLRNPDGTLYWLGTTFVNPLASLSKLYRSSTQFFIANGNIDYNFLQGFHLKLNTGYTRNVLNQNNTNPISSQNPASVTSNSATFATSVSSNYIVEPQIDYTLKKGKSTFLALLGGTIQKSTNQFSNINATNYAFPGLLTSVAGAGTYTAGSSYNLYKYAAAFGRLNYNNADKYLLNLTFRRDASSRFGSNHQFANFGAVGAGWIFTDEPFLKADKSVLSFGKLRASYGSTGNDQLPNYQNLALYNTTTAYQGSSALTLSGVSNPDLAWETTKKLEFGLDLGFFKDRLFLTADYYVHHSGNLLTYGNLPNQAGYNSINENLDAVVENKGYEFTLTSTNIQTKDLKWTSSFNISFQTTKMLSFNAATTAFYGSSFLVGYPVPPTFTYSYGGINPTTGAVIINDRDGNSIINTIDRYAQGIRNPFYGGLNNTINYKQFSINFFLQFNNNYGNVNSIYGTRPGSFNNQNVSALDRWTTPGQTGTLFPAASGTPGGTGVVYATYNNYGNSDVFYGNTLWAKLRSASLSYQLPQQMTSKWGISTARLYLQGQNIYTWAKQKYVLDPETGTSLPPLRTIVVGLNVNFK